MLIDAEYVEVHIFRRINNKLEFLILKRSEKETYPGIWQPITGSVNENEKAYEAAIREIKEEISIDPLKFWVVPNVSSFYMPNKDMLSFVPVFAAEVPADKNVKLSDEHSDFKWVGCEEASDHYAWVKQRESIKIIYDHFTSSSHLNFTEIKIR